MNDNAVIRGVRARLWRRNQNWLCCLCGPTGSGKSWTGLAIACAIDKDFSADRIVFTPQAFMALLNGGKLKRGSVILVDEAGIAMGARDWQSRANRNFGYVLQSFRHLNYGVVFTTPSFSFVDKQARNLFHAYGETKLIDREHGFVRLKWFNIEHNALTGKTYSKYPRVRADDGRIMKVTHLDIYKAPDSIIQAYEAKKREYLAGLNQDIADKMDGKKVKPKRGRPKNKETKRTMIVRELKNSKLSNLEIAKKCKATIHYVRDLRAETETES